MKTPPRPAAASSTSLEADEAAGLLTVRDLLRWATSRFEEARLVYGHGTSRALDEAAFVILATLHLPIDELDPWLDARLLPAERRAVIDAVVRRIESRKPAAYVVGCAYIQGHRFMVDERVIVPRSYIGELICRSGLDDLLSTPPSRILDVCTGSGCLAILAALAWPEARVGATDASPAALEVARTNVADYGLDERITLIEGDLLAPVGAQRYDLILANPPYVPAGRVDAFPPEHAAEPRMAHDGGADGLDLVHRILAAAPQHLEPDGVLVMEVGTARNALEAACPALPFLWLDTAESEGEVLAIRSGELVPPGARRKPQRRRGAS